MNKAFVVVTFVMILLINPSKSDDYTLNLIKNNDLKYYEEHGCDEAQIQIKEGQNNLLLIKYAFDSGTNKITSEIEFGCDLKPSSKQNSFSNYGGKCKVTRPPDTCPTCTTASVNVSMIKFNDYMVISDPLSRTADFSGIYKICKTAAIAVNSDIKQEKSTIDLSSNLAAQIKILSNLMNKKNVVCRATYLKDTNPWNEYSGEDLNKVTMAEFNVDFVVDKKIVTHEVIKKGQSMEFLTDQNDTAPLDTKSGKKIPFLCEYKNYCAPLENMSIDESSCKKLR